jgi:hypothetical protein
MNTSELTALHTETITALHKAAQESRTLANISRRAASLLTDGYQVRGYEGTDFYVVTSPKGAKYQVWHGVKVGYECGCPCFTEWNTCKHLEAIDQMKQDEEQAAEYDARDAYDLYEYRH